MENKNENATTLLTYKSKNINLEAEGETRSVVEKNIEPESINTHEDNTVINVIIPTKAYTSEDLEEVNEKLIALLDKTGRLGFLKEAGKSSLGFITNAGAFVALNFAAPGLGIWNGLIASSIGSFAHMVTDRVTGNDRGPGYKTAIMFLDAINVSQGAHAVSSLIAQGNVTAEFVLNTVVPALVQSDWYNRHAQGVTAQKDLVEIKTLMAEHVKIAESLGVESPFVPAAQEYKLS